MLSTGTKGLSVCSGRSEATPEPSRHRSIESVDVGDLETSHEGAVGKAMSISFDVTFVDMPELFNNLHCLVEDDRWAVGRRLPGLRG